MKILPGALVIVDETVAEAIASSETDILNRMRMRCQLLETICVACFSKGVRRQATSLLTVISCIVMMALVTPHSQTTKGH
ncbi:hypothetical protein ACEYW6_29615 [Nostoc sp. UIC 10607]|uniref:hypothetical protein n=1 Tax=Nostoc sp. UIC 10607 TaxID=3045935 RepID=UPI0039A12E8F